MYICMFCNDIFVEIHCFYIGEGDISQAEIEEAVRRSETATIWGSNSSRYTVQDYSFKEIIRSTLEAIGKKMKWRQKFAFRKKSDPIEAILGEHAEDFYRAFDDLGKGKISIIACGQRTENPFLLYTDETSYVAGVSNASQQTLFYGYGLLETWRADPRVHLFHGEGISAFQLLFSASLAYLLALYIGAGLSTAKEVQKIFDPESRLQSNLAELTELTKKKAWLGSWEIQQKAAIALRGYLSAWFDFMEKSSWLEIHHTLHDTKVVEKEQSFLDTATTEISETAREIILDQMVGGMFSAEEMERREMERRGKQMQWTMFRIALGILYPREKAIIRSQWEKSKRRLTWKELEETYYEEIWDLMRVHLSGQDLEKKILEKDKATLGRWHFIFELKKSERPREKVRTLESMTLAELLKRKNKLLSLLTWEGQGLPAGTSWNDVVTRFRKIIIKYHPDRAEITGIDPDEAQRVSTEAIQNFRELEIIHDLQPELFGMESSPADHFAPQKS